MCGDPLTGAVGSDPSALHEQTVVVGDRQQAGHVLEGPGKARAGWSTPAGGRSRKRSSVHAGGQWLVERRQQLSDRSADFAGQRAALIEIHRMWPGPDAPYLDARTQMDGAAAQALEECIELLVILRAGVLALPKPGPKVLPDVVVVVRADLSEIVSRPAVDVLGDLEVTVRVEPLGDGGVPEGEVHVRPGLPRLGMLCHEVQEPLSPAGPV